MTISEDGRLREKIKVTPPNWILNITNTRWLVTDKLNDIWIDDIFYDLQMKIDLEQFEYTNILTSPNFEATTIGLILESSQSEGESLGNAQLTRNNGEVYSLTIPSKTTSNAIRLQIHEPMYLQSIQIESTNNSLKLLGAALIDERTNTFETLTLGSYRIIHSGDVKVYENLNVFPLAYMVARLPLNEETKTIGRTVIQKSRAHEIEIDTNNSDPSILILAQTAYPGWQATIDGKLTNIVSSNGLFSAIALDAGNHKIIFQYKPRSWQVGVWTSITMLILWLITFRFTQTTVYPSH
jgi:uncharacterized membrane protein YfhO